MLQDWNSLYKGKETTAWRSRVDFQGVDGAAMLVSGYVNMISDDCK
jgi:hypothetical protein